jgi:fermentation-respiration switch protein FrsA (DUF1100 family)
MPKYEEVRIASRDPRIALSGWYVPGALGRSGPAVVVVHGLSSCKRQGGVLLPAGMLHRHGFSVLLVDLRDHGESAFEDGRYAGGTEEYLDVLGAWDWLQLRGHPAQRIGLLGRSMGAASVLIAAGEEPRVAATWEDSGYAAVDEAIHDELVRQRYPTWLAPAGILAARVIAGDDIASRSPLGAVTKLHGRPLFITHGDRDESFSVRFAYELADAVRRSGGRVELWIVRGAGHVQAAQLVPQEYERRLADFFARTLGGD